MLKTTHPESEIKGIFDNISDEVVEKNIPVAENTIKTNIEKGLLSKDVYSIFPNIRNGLALLYAAADNGKHNLSNLAYEVAYTKNDELLVKDMGKFLQNELPKIRNTFGNQLTGQTAKRSSFYDDNSQNKEPSKNNNNSWNVPGKAIDLSEANKNPRYVQSDVLNMRSAPGTNSKIIDRLINGTEVNYTGNKTEEIDGHLWAEITYDGKTGWVAADHLMIEKPDTVPFDSGYAKNYSYDDMEEALTKTDLDAGVKISESSNSEYYYYDYTDVIMNRVNEVLPDFLNHKIMSYPEYCKKFSNWLYSPTLQEYYAVYLKDYIYFYNQVKSEAPWDIKEDASWKQQFGDIRMPYYFGDPDINEKFLFRGEEVSRENLGNILYGYLGSAMGISDTKLYQGGGIAADWKNIFNGKLFDENEYFGDDKTDHNYIKKGIEMFYEDYPEAKT